MKIHIETLTKKIYTFDLNADDTIRSIKQKLRNSQGIPKCQQRLIFNHVQLMEKWPLIKSKEVNSVKYYFVQIEDGTILNDQLFAEYSEAQKLYQTVESPEQEVLLSDYDIKEGSILFLVLRMSGDIGIFVSDTS